PRPAVVLILCCEHGSCLSGLAGRGRPVSGTVLRRRPGDHLSSGCSFLSAALLSSPLACSSLAVRRDRYRWSSTTAGLRSAENGLPGRRRSGTGVAGIGRLRGRCLAPRLVLGLPGGGRPCSPALPHVVMRFRKTLQEGHEKSCREAIQQASEEAVP